MLNAGLSHFQKALKNFSRLESLNLSIARKSQMHDESLGILIRGFKVHMTLRIISFFFSDCHQITDQGVRYLYKGLKNLIFLRDFSLGVHACHEITDKGLQSIEKILKKLKSLQRVSLLFTHCDEISFGCSLECITRGFEIVGASQMAIKLYGGLSEGCELELNDPTKNPSSFVSFQMEFWAKKMGTDVLSLERVLFKHTNLQHLDVEYKSPCEMEESTLDLIRKALGILYSLQAINLKFPMNNQIARAKLKWIGESFKSLPF